MISTQIKAIVGQLSVTTVFKYGTANEINAWVCTNKTWPVACMFKIPTVPSEYTLSLAIDEGFALMIEFLYQSAFPSADTEQDESLVTTAKNLANEFMVKLANYRESPPDGGRYFRIKRGQKATKSPINNKYDSNCCGVMLRMTVNTMYNDNVPLNA